MEKIKICKMFGFLEILLRILYKIFWFAVIYKIASIIGGIIFKGFDNQLLYSISFIPCIDILKTMPKDLLYPFTVRAKFSNETVEATVGFYDEFRDILSLKNIENIETHQTTLGKIFGYKNITLYSPGASLLIPFVKNADKVIDKIKIIIKENNNGN